MSQKASLQPPIRLRCKMSFLPTTTTSASVTVEVPPRISHSAKWYFDIDIPTSLTYKPNPPPPPLTLSSQCHNTKENQKVKKQQINNLILLHNNAITCYPNIFISYRFLFYCTGLKIINYLRYNLPKHFFTATNTMYYEVKDTLVE